MELWWRNSFKNADERLVRYGGVDSSPEGPLATFNQKCGQCVGLTMSEIGDAVVKHDQLARSGPSEALHHAMNEEMKLLMFAVAELHVEHKVPMDPRIREPDDMELNPVGQIDYTHIMQSMRSGPTA